MYISAYMLGALALLGAMLGGSVGLLQKSCRLIFTQLVIESMLASARVSVLTLLIQTKLSVDVCSQRHRQTLRGTPGVAASSAPFALRDRLVAWLSIPV